MADFITWLHTNQPQAIVYQIGPVQIHWYGLLFVAGVIAALLVAIGLGKQYQIYKDTLVDLFFWLIIFGLIGGRLYYVLLEWGYYQKHFLDIFKIWQGGLAIHGGIIAGLLVLWRFARKMDPVRNNGASFWLLSSLLTPGLALAQSIGRWGNYFNQELFGQPTDSIWGLAIAIAHRPVDYASFSYFQPTFLYESIGLFIIFIILLLAHFYTLYRDRFNYHYHLCISLTYVILASGLRFIMEFIRIDPTPIILGVRLPQIVCAILILASLAIMFYDFAKRKKLSV